MPREIAKFKMGDKVLVLPSRKSGVVQSKPWWDGQGYRYEVHINSRDSDKGLWILQEITLTSNQIEDVS